MKKILTVLASITLAVIMACTALWVYADTTYVPEDDPLISLSYVNKVLLPQVKEMIADALEGKDITDVEITGPEDTTATEPAPEEPEEVLPEGTVSTGSRYATVNLKEGQQIFASVYSCELIVRSGDAKVVSPFTVKWEEQGVSDTTEGKEIYNDEWIAQNHNIIIPRDDGRGVVALEGGAWIMVRGDYIIKDANGNVVVSE